MNQMTMMKKENLCIYRNKYQPHHHLTMGLPCPRRDPKRDDATWKKSGE